MGEEDRAYQIWVSGDLGKEWSDWFMGLEIETEWDDQGAVVTSLTGPVADQAALRGILVKLWDLNLKVISVAQIDRT
jgi:hypothetical protein